jgi:hypothetical protein
VEHFYQHAPHQYNEKTRSRVYRFFARHLMGKDLEWEEQPIETGDLNDLTWFRGNGHAPGFGNDEEYFSAHKVELAARIEALPPSEKRKMLSWVTGIRKGEFRTTTIAMEQRNGLTVEKFVVNGDRGEMLPAIKLIPAGWDGKRVCLALGGDGKDCLDTSALKAMLADGIALISGDLFLTGESRDAKQEVAETDIRSPYYTQNHLTTFNDTVDALRIQDVALLIRVAGRAAETLTVWASGQAARATACALPLCEGVTNACLEAAALSLKGDDAYYRDFFVPGICALGGLQGCLALANCAVDTF